MVSTNGILAEYQKWAAQSKPYHPRRRDVVAGAFHIVTRLLNFHLTISSVLFGGVRGVSAAIVATAPVAIKLAQDRFAPQAAMIPWKLAVLAACGTFMLTIYNRIYDIVAKFRKASGLVLAEEGALSVVANNAIDRLGKADLINLDAGDKRKVIQDILNAIRFQTRIIIGNFDEKYLEVTLLLFTTKECSEMIISERALRIRSIDTKVLANQTMAYYVSKTGMARAVHDFRKRHPFKREGISAKETKYKSILFIPLIKRLSESHYRCFGVVTIDSERAYEFWGGTQQRLVIRIQPYLNLLRWILADAPYLESAGDGNGAHG